MATLLFFKSLSRSLQFSLETSLKKCKPKKQNLKAKIQQQMQQQHQHQWSGGEMSAKKMIVFCKRGGQNAQRILAAYPSEMQLSKGKNLFPVAGKKLEKRGAAKRKNAQRMEMEKTAKKKNRM